MQNIMKSNENYCLDKTYKNGAGNGTIKIVSKKKSSVETVVVSDDENVLNLIKPEKERKKKSLVNALFSTRLTKNGYVIVVTRQPNTSEKSYELALKLKSEMQIELLTNNRFKNDYEGFSKWFTEKEQVLKNNGFHELKD